MPGTLTLTIGLPGSGKSHWADAQATADPNVVIVERDRIREELTGDRRDMTQEGRVTAVAKQRALKALYDDRHVIVSDTNLVGKYRREWKDMAHDLRAHYAEQSFLDVPYALCVERNAARPDPVPDDVMEKFRIRAGVRA